jgi:hypothetical protein
MVMDASKAQVEGEFRRKLRDAGCQTKQTETHTQSSTMGEGDVRELKNDVGRKMIGYGCPKRFWEYKKFGTSMDMDDFKDDPDYADFVTPTYDCYEDYEVSSSKMPYIDDIKE